MKYVKIRNLQIDRDQALPVDMKSTVGHVRGVTYLHYKGSQELPGETHAALRARRG